MKPEAHDCPEASELAAFARGAVSGERARVIQAHVASCPDCRAGARDEHDSGVFGRMLRDWRSRMTPEERRRTIDSATRTIADAQRAGDEPRREEGPES
jgi:anti-sigma factor ChrR (cupin superfamily)